MKISARIAIAAMLGSSAWAATKSDRQKLVVCIDGAGHASVAGAMAGASGLFKLAGVSPEWHSGRGGRGLGCGCVFALS